MTLLAATHDDMCAWADSLVDTFTLSTRYVKISRVHGFYRWLLDEGRTTTLPTARIPRPKIPRAVPRPIPRDRLDVALDNAPPLIRVWLILGSFAGLRCCEIAPMTRESVVDTADPPYLVVPTKGGGHRIVMMCERVRLELRGYGLPTRGWLWPRLDGKPGHPAAHRVSQMINEWLHEQGIPDTAHSLRARFGTDIQAASGDIYVTARCLGHRNVQNATIYAELADDAAARAVRALDRPRLAAVAP